MLKPSVASVFLLFLQHGSEFVRRRNVAVSQSRTLLCTPDSSSKIVTRLIDQGFIDERRYARAYASAKLRNQKWGRLKVIYQLRSKQVPPKFISEALAEIPEEEYRNILLDVAKTKWDTYPATEPNAKRRSKLVTFLASRGYESPVIQSMIEENYNAE